MKKKNFLRAVIISLILPVGSTLYASRTITTFPVSVSSNDRSSGTATGADFLTTLNCQNVGTSAQTVRAEILNPILFMQIKTKSGSAAPALPGWAKINAFYFCEFKPGGGQPTGATSCSGDFGTAYSAESFTLGASGTDTDSARISFSKSCGYSSSGPNCTNANSFYFVAKTIHSTTESTTGQYVCQPDADPNKCEDFVGASMTLRMSITINEDKGGIICSLTNSVQLKAARKQLSTPSTIPINGGRPF